MRPFTTTWDMLLWWLQLEFCAGLVTIWVIIFLSLSIFCWNIILYFFIAAVVIVICLSISSFCHIQFFQLVKRHKIQIQAQQQALQNADNNLNIMRLKKSSVKTFVFYIVMILCYFPMLLNLVLMATNAMTRYWNLYTSIVFLNSSINPILYCWRLSDLRSATVKTARKIFGKHTDQL